MTETATPQAILADRPIPLATLLAQLVPPQMAAGTELAVYRGVLTPRE